MSTEKGNKKTKAGAAESNVVSWQEKRILADEEEKALEKEIEELKAWTNIMDKMDEGQLKKYARNRPDHLKTKKTAENARPTGRVQKAGKGKTSESCRIMASVWKFHEEEEEEDDDEGSSTKSNV